MVKSAWFGYIIATRPKYVKVSFRMLFIHIGLVNTIDTYIFIGLNICYGQIKFCLYCFFRNMHLSAHMGGIWWFWLHIWNLLKIWTQKTYRPTYVVSLWVNLILGLEYWNIHSKGNRPDMKIPSSDPPSAHQIGPDDVLMTSVEGCYTISFLITQINLIVAEAIGQLWRFCVQILNLHKKPV